MPRNRMSQALPISVVGQDSDLQDILQMAEDLEVPLTMEELLMAIQGEL
jgi:hypothetical protein